MDSDLPPQGGQRPTPFQVCPLNQTMERASLQLQL